MERLLVCAGLAVSTLLLFGLAYPAFLGLVYTGTDLGNLHLPIKHFYHTSLATGSGWIWWPNELGGFYLHGEGQAGLSHPLNLMLYRLRSLTLAFNLELVRNYLLLLPGTFLFLRRLALPRDAAVFGAMLFTFSAFNLLHYMHLNMIAGVAHLPWLLFAIDIQLRDPNPRRVALATLLMALLTASQLLVSHLQVVWMSIFAEVIFVLLTSARTRTVSRAIRVAASATIGAIIASIQVLPTFETYLLSFRASASERFLGSFSLHSVDLFQLVAPYVVRYDSKPHNLTEYGLYAGAVAPVLVVWLFMRRRSLGQLRTPAISALGVAAVALILAHGETSFLFRLLSDLPFVGSFRAPARYVVIFQFAVAIACAIAFCDLRLLVAGGHRLSFRSMAFLVAPLLASAGFGAGAVVMGTDLQPRIGSTDTLPAAALIGSLLSAVATLLVVASARGVPAAMAAMVAFAAFDLGAYGLSYVWLDRPIDIETLTRHHTPPRGSRLEDIVAKHRVLLSPPAATMSGERQMGGWVAMTPDRKLIRPEMHHTSRIAQFRHFLDLPHATREAALRVASVGWVRGPVPNPLPRVRLLTRAVQSETPIELIGDIDVDTTAIVEVPVELDGGTAGRASLEHDRPGEIGVISEATGRQLLVLSESYHPGWRVEIDGRPGEIIRAYGDFMGTALEAGTHSVNFVFDPASLRAGKRLSAAGLCAAILWFSSDWWRLRRYTAKSALSG